MSITETDLPFVLIAGIIVLALSTIVMCALKEFSAKLRNIDNHRVFVNKKGGAFGYLSLKVITDSNMKKLKALSSLVSEQRKYLTSGLVLLFIPGVLTAVETGFLFLFTPHSISDIAARAITVYAVSLIVVVDLLLLSTVLLTFTAKIITSNTQKVNGVDYVDYELNPSNKYMPKSKWREKLNTLYTTLNELLNSEKRLKVTALLESLYSISNTKNAHEEVRNAEIRRIKNALNALVEEHQEEQQYIPNEQVRTVANNAINFANEV